MATKSADSRTQRGEIETLPSGALRVRVYSGLDPLTGKRVYLTETVPAGPKAARQAEKIRTRFLAQVDERRSPRTKATVNQLLDRHFDELDVEEQTKNDYRSLAAKHIRPLIGSKPLAKVTGELQDSFYRELRRCRDHCDGKRFKKCRTTRPHECDHRCREHTCSGLSDASIRKIQSILKGAGKRAFRWEWVGSNPFDKAESQPAPKPNPQAPTPTQAAAILMESWYDLDWGMFIWTKTIAGSRRGETCAFRWRDFDPDSKLLHVKRNIRQRGSRTWEKDVKTHQERKLSLDDMTVQLLIWYRSYCAERAGLHDMPDDAFIFTASPDGSTYRKPDTVSQRFERLCARLGWDMHIHEMRHYNITELISHGVDLRTVAGRVGHSGGGVTTLKYYSGFRLDADQRAVQVLASSMPIPPIDLNAAKVVPQMPAVNLESPYLKIAADLKGAIACGALQAGDYLPQVARLAERYGVSFGTAQRAIGELRSAGLVAVSRGKRAVVIDTVMSQTEPLADVVGLDNRRREGRKAVPYASQPTESRSSRT
ncbi:tyrosine-type recombinase/integrase [Saccharothrix sp. NPDC042600]|uniref:tyrosine-type recombinase/integrase n=1 Tax=Saccharothrix TaxID=2071 RepID=UPI0033DC7A8D